MDIITSRKAAILAGCKTYFTGKPCKHGHICDRAISGNCVECLKKWQVANSERRKAKQWALNLKNKYSLGPGDLNRMFRTQDYKCAICGKHSSQHGPAGLMVDHNHTTNKVRGLLCGGCNPRLGWYENNKEAIQDYIS